MDEKITNENTSQKFNWKHQEVHLLQWMNFRWKTIKIITGMKERPTRESCVFTAAFHWYITCSILVSGWRATSSGWRSTSKKVTWKTEWSSGTRTEKFRFFTRCIFEKSVSRYRQNEWSRHFRNYLKTARIQRKPSTWKSFAFSVAFQRYVICPIPIKFVEITAKIRF